MCNKILIQSVEFSQKSIKLNAIESPDILEAIDNHYRTDSDPRTVTVVFDLSDQHQREYLWKRVAYQDKFGRWHQKKGFEGCKTWQDIANAFIDREVLKFCKEYMEYGW